MAEKAVAKTTPVNSTELADPELFEFLTKTELSEFKADAEFIDNYLLEIGLTEADFEYVGSDFEKIDKAELVDVPLFIIQWDVKVSREFGSLYAVVHAIRLDDMTKIVFADGGTGIAAQLMELTTKRQGQGFPPKAWSGGVKVKNGLVRSDYDAHPNASGVMVPAGTTYYLG